jgi:hypothetical protein
LFNLTLWRPAMIAVATVTALAAGGGAAYAAAMPSTAPASTTPGGVIYATGVHASAVQSMKSSSPDGALTLKTTDAYAADQISDNWSGYETTPKKGAYQLTSTSFTVPASIVCTSTDTASSFWAGLDGDGDSTVEQDGVEADCTGGSLVLYAWLETYPVAEEEIVTRTGAPAPVEPGDVFYSTVDRDSPSDFTFDMDDATQDWSFDTTVKMPNGYTGEGLTSEVIAEATTECASASASSCAPMPLTNFGQVAYTSTQYNNTDYASSNTTPIEMVQSGGIGDSVGALGTDGAFTVTYGIPKVIVPSEIGRADLATAEAGIRAAGLVPKATGASAVGNLGTVTAESPAAGTSVDLGSTVTLTYTLAKVTVPSEIGRADLATAEAGIRAAGLVPKAVGASGAGNKGKVTAESPAAGTKVAKGSTVTLTYTVTK